MQFMKKMCTRPYVYSLERRWGLTKIIRVMRLTILLLTVAFLHTHASGTAQSVTLSGKNLTMDQVFAAVKKQTGYVVFSNKDFFTSRKTVSLSISDRPLNDLLDVVLRDQPFEYSISDKTIFISPKTMMAVSIKPVIPTSPPDEKEEAVPIRGRVVNEVGEPLAGASVKIVGTKQGTHTLGDGSYSIDVPNENTRLEISFVGYETVIVTASTTQVVLKRSDSKLDEVQVIAYGTTTRRLSTSNISSVKGEVLAKSPVLNPLQALQGRVPGITIESNSGLPGAYVSVRVQGQNSLARGNNPLYIVNGIPYPSTNLKDLSNILGWVSPQAKNGVDNYGESSSGSPLNYINMNDIESIEVLKDADATAIYGSRGANGVILITTKKGKAGPIKFDLNLQHGMAKVAKKMKLLNTQEYLEMRREAYRNDGLAVPDRNTTPDPSNYDLTFWDENKYTDWQKELIGGTAKYTNLYASAIGGTENAQYLIGTTYRRQTTVFPGDFINQSAGANMNLNLSSDNKKFKAGVSVQYFFTNSNNPDGDLTTSIYRPPNAPNLKNPDGSLNWALLPNGVSSIDNPLIVLEQRYRTNTTNFNSNADIGYEIIPGLEVKSTFGYSQMQSESRFLRPLSAIRPHERQFVARQTGIYNSKTTTWQIEPQLTYSKEIADGKLNVLMGTTFSENTQYSQDVYAWGGTNDLLIEDISSHPSFTNGKVNAPKYRYTAGFARINYVWRDKYVVNLNGRRDGSSRFGSENIFHNFGSVGGAWIFSNEGFIKSALPFLSFGKIYGSYGTIGNDNIGNYSQLSLYGLTIWGTNIPYQSTTPIGPLGLPNPSLQWEEIRKLSFGLDLGFFKDRLLVNTIWYRNRSSNQLTSFSLPRITGFYGIDRNFPAKIQNSGWEFTARSINIDGKNWKWTTDANLTIQRNKLLEFPGIETTSYWYSLIVGEPLNIEKYYHYLGVSPETGLYTYEDETGKPTSTPAETDRTVYRSAFPIFTAGMTNTITYKNFQLDFVLHIVKQYGVNLEQGANPGTMGNQPTFVLDRWQKTGDVAKLQKFSTTYAGDAGTAMWRYGGSDAGYGDASFVRLSNLTFSWTFPQSFIKNIRLKNARVFMLGQNLFTLTSYKGLDPEQRNGFYSTLPPLRVITFGLQLTF